MLVHNDSEVKGNIYIYFLSKLDGVLQGSEESQYGAELIIFLTVHNPLVFFFFLSIPLPILKHFSAVCLLISIAH